MNIPRPIVVNQSSLKAYLDCHRLYGWERIARLTPPLRRSAPSIGIAAHKALAAYHAGDSLEKCVSLLRKEVKNLGGPRSAFEDKSIAEAGAIGENVFRAYVTHYEGSGETWSPLNQEVEFLVEVQPGWWRRTFSEEVSEEDGKRLDAEWARQPTGVFLRGRADNLSFLKGALFLVDYKTAGKMDPRELMKYEMDLQLSAYIYGLSKQLTLESQKTGGPAVKVEGAVIDLLVKTKIPQFARESYTRSDSEMEEFEFEYVEYGREIRSRFERVDAGESWKVVFPKNTQHCFRYGTCAYRDLCLKDTPVRRAAFTQRPPDYVDEAQHGLLERWRNAE